ncbi:Dolichol-phosphate mannosyltransferase in lipid-linked oligosaccharide synthesis cluster [Sphingobacterium faecium PCAi_F2.5]|nr:Dolichol-phosphate mannosyltransferase in lipid-linked oligosaccharide synthesis cluster [Sphingobacterium faecium PCAi_F2.5]
MKQISDIFVVIVLYNSGIYDSETLKSILDNNKLLKLQGVIYDNSLKSQSIYGIDNLGDFAYKHNGNNPGLAVAYNFALENAKKDGFNWLLLLDQDTILTESFFHHLCLLDLNSDPEIVAYIPVTNSLSKNNELISPSKLGLGGFKPFVNFTYGKQKARISGINSGTLINCNFMGNIGGFNKEYPLDMLDHWYFREIYRSGKCISVFKGQIFQNLSVSNISEANMSISRYKNFVRAEDTFFRTSSFFQFIFFKCRLLFRSLKYFKLKNKSYFSISIKNFFKL